MNTLINSQNKELTMSSREIAELTNKEHKNVLRVIRDLISAQVLDAQIEPLKFEYRNQWFDYYELNKRDSLVIVARLSPEFMAFVVDRWQELEQQVSNNQLKLPSSKELALMVIQAEEEKEKLQLEVDYLKPKAAFHDMAVDIHGAVSVGQAAKTLGTGRNRLLQLMRQRKWINRRNEPYQDKIEQGLLDVKLSNWEHPEKGIQDVITTLVTGKGITKLTKMLSTKLVA
ncbi:hypothetical protein A9G39_02460 [Gilliamella sp. Imp1-6]|uniref:phage antirepressor KilAC domain-containing protein n=1 Tax=Gilliamella sp. GillExp13 TaxID=3120243 RepID=UPI00080E5AFE|nr:phage antirepressor KilAC domain-containing protein [Gilliamella apicola]OCG58752.1 hypothetical protein A9G37_06580 [Gilliamella apicola]OCG68475.1 hypothetical protein A9G39_02460 [Gilliamella apicola]